MRYLRMLGLMLLTALALGAYATATASAEEPGVLTLKGVSEKVEIKAGEAKNPVLNTAAGEIKCTKLEPTTTSATGAHILLFNEVDLMFSECEEVKGATKLKCRSENLKGEKDLEGVILVLVDFHLVDLLNESTLEPGIVAIILDQTEKVVGNLKLKCGIGNVEVKGEVKGLIKNVSLTVNVAAGEISFSTTFDKCDTNDLLCLKYEELNASKEPIEFLSNIGGTFEKASQTTLSKFTTNVEVLFDD